MGPCRLLDQRSRGGRGHGRLLNIYTFWGFAFFYSNFRLQAEGDERTHTEKEKKTNSNLAPGKNLYVNITFLVCPLLLYSRRNAWEGCNTRFTCMFKFHKTDLTRFPGLHDRLGEHRKSCDSSKQKAKKHTQERCSLNLNVSLN